MYESLITGFAQALTASNLLYAFAGVFIGNAIGVLPGIGALAAISMLLPMTYGLDPAGSIVMLAGIYYGTSFGGATTSILLNLPGTSAHAVVCLDGHPLAKQGKAGEAILVAMLASFVGVAFAVLVVIFLSPVIVDVAFSFGAAEYCTLMMVGLLSAVIINQGSVTNGLIAIAMGLLLGVVGTDVNSGVQRFSFGVGSLEEGIGIIVIAMGLFGVSDILSSGDRSAEGRQGSLDATGGGHRRYIAFDRAMMKRSRASMARGSVLGSAIGALPGAGSTIASFMAYAVEKKCAKDKDRFGHGAIEGVAGPEAANSSADIAAFIPTLTLGIPGSATMALLLGALMIHNIAPGPRLVTEHPELFWGLIASFIIGNLMLLVINIPLIKMWVRLLTVPYRYIYPVVMILIAIGVYSTNNNLFDIGSVLLVGIVGCWMKRMKISAAAVLLSYVLGPMVEENFRRALLYSDGDLSTFITRPISGGIIAVTVAVTIFMYLRQRRAARRALA